MRALILAIYNDQTAKVTSKVCFSYGNPPQKWPKHSVGSSLVPWLGDGPLNKRKGPNIQVKELISNKIAQIDVGFPIDLGFHQEFESLAEAWIWQAFVWWSWVVWNSLGLLLLCWEMMQKPCRKLGLIKGVDIYLRVGGKFIKFCYFS